MKRILTITLTLAMLLALTIPAFASEGDDMPVEIEQEEPAEPLPDLEEPSAEEDFPEEILEELPEETPEEPPEMEEVPEESPEDTEVSDVPELPDGSASTEPADDDLSEDDPVIEVVVPETGRVVINPYGLPVTVEGQETTEQIAGSTMLLENRSTVAVEVSVSAVGETLGGVVLAEQPPVFDAWEKEVFLYAEFQPLDYLDTEPVWSSYFADDANQILITSGGLWKDDLLRLEATGEPYSWAAARLFGSVAAYPEQPWESGDGFRIDLAFTFTPVSEEPSVFDEPWDEPVELPDDPVINEAPDETQEEEPAPSVDDPVELHSEVELEPDPEPIPDQFPEVPSEDDVDEAEAPVPDSDMG